MIRYSAPAKIILSGEHSVVYGKPAFVSAIDIRLTCVVEETTEPESTDPAFLHCKEVVLDYLKRKTIAHKVKPVRFELSSDIPEGRGMGSSAALCVAMTASLYHFYTGSEAEKQIINTLAYQAEQYFHGMPSSVDVSASTQGGLIYYRKEFEFLKTVSSLNFKLPQIIVDKLVLIDSGKPIESTAEMVKLVGKRYNDSPQAMEKTLMLIEKMTKRLVVATVKEDPQLFADTITENQSLLTDLGIVSPQTQQLMMQLEGYGVGKVTGAGGSKGNSGFILFFTHDKEALIKFLNIQKISYLPFIQDFEGVKKL